MMKDGKTVKMQGTWLIVHAVLLIGLLAVAVVVQHWLRSVFETICVKQPWHVLALLQFGTVLKSHVLLAPLILLSFLYADWKAMDSLPQQRTGLWCRTVFIGLVGTVVLAIVAAVTPIFRNIVVISG